MHPWIRLYSDLTKSKADTLANREAASEKKLRAKGGKGNWSGIEVRFQAEMLDRTLYALWVKPLDDETIPSLIRDSRA